jgi:hypothetical protein
MHPRGQAPLTIYVVAFQASYPLGDLGSSSALHPSRALPFKQLTSPTQSSSPPVRRHRSLSLLCPSPPVVMIELVIVDPTELLDI